MSILLTPTTLVPGDTVKGGNSWATDGSWKHLSPPTELSTSACSLRVGAGVTEENVLESGPRPEAGSLGHL